MTAPSLTHTYAELRWTDDMDPTAAETDSDFESLTQDVLHILMERQGSNLADEQNGIGAADYLSGTSAQLAAMPALIDSQLASVRRITSSRTTMLLQPDGTWLINVAIQVGTAVTALRFALGPGGVTVTP